MSEPYNRLSPQEHQRRLRVYKQGLSHRESVKQLGLTPGSYRSWMCRSRLCRMKPLLCPKHHIRVRMRRDHSHEGKEHYTYTRVRSRRNHTHRGKYIARSSMYEKGNVYCRQCADSGSGWFPKEKAVQLSTNL